MIQEPDLLSRTQVWAPIPADKPEPVPTPAPPAKSRLWPVQTVLCALLCAAVLACKAFSPAATQVLEDLVIGTGESRLRSAAACFESALDTGSVGGALSVFCDELLTP